MTNYYWSIYTELVISVLFSLQQMTKMTKLGPPGYTDTFGSGKCHHGGHVVIVTSCSITRFLLTCNTG